MNGRTCARQNTALLYGAVRRWADDQSFAVIAGRAEGCSATGGIWPLASLRTDSVNRGLSISLLMLAIVVLGDSLELFLFFVIPQY
jgi:hypothetical protein